MVVQTNSGIAGRAGKSEVSSSGPATSGSAGSLGVQDLTKLDILTAAKLWRSQKHSIGELVDLVQPYTGVTPAVTAVKASTHPELVGCCFCAAVTHHSDKHACSKDNGECAMTM